MLCGLEGNRRRRVSDLNPTFALAAETIFLLVSDYINCIALLCLNEICM